MGISALYARAICREHVHRPFTGRVFTVGRQTMLFGPAEALVLASEAGLYALGLHAADLGIDTDTRASTGNDYISDRAFFNILGVENLESIDVSDYEGASVVHDLNQPLPDELEGVADVIVDGSTLDNVFDPAMALKNMARMLKPGGRLLSFNLGSNHYCPYVVLTPLWLFDYFVVNDFVDCQVYVVVFGDRGPNILCVDPATMLLAPRSIPNVETPHTIGLAVMAEKGANSTWDISPVQHQYRPEDQHTLYRERVAVLQGGDRPDLLFTEAGRFITPPGGYRFIPPVSP